MTTTTDNRPQWHGYALGAAISLIICLLVPRRWLPWTITLVFICPLPMLLTFKTHDPDDLTDTDVDLFEPTQGTWILGAAILAVMAAWAYNLYMDRPARQLRSAVVPPTWIETTATEAHSVQSEAPGTTVVVRHRGQPFPTPPWRRSIEDHGSFTITDRRASAGLD